MYLRVDKSELSTLSISNVRLSKKQIFRLVLAALFFVLLLMAIFCHYGHLWVKLFAILANVLLMASMLISLFDVKKHPEKDE